MRARHGVKLDRRHLQGPPRKLTARAQPRRLDARLLERDQVAQRVRDVTEPIGKLGAQLVQVGDLARACDPPVHLDLGLLVRDVIRGDVRVDVDVEADRLGQVAVLVGVGGADRLVEHLHVELEAERGHVPRLLVAEQVPAPAQSCRASRPEAVALFRVVAGREAVAASWVSAAALG